MAGDPDPETRHELATLLAAATDVSPVAHEAMVGGALPDAAAATAELADSLSGPLAFGTAGLRGRLGAGPNRMNLAVTRRATAGLCAHLRELVGSDFTVVIGYDARHGSRRFARDAAAVVGAAGGRALVLDEPGPTPLLAFAARHLGADGAVMVTASHNPPQDNGYKVYLGGRAVTGAAQGTQIVPPHDAAIAAAIEAAAPAAQIPADGPWEVVDPAVRAAYLDRVASLAPGEPASALRVVLTSLHGVGGQMATEALQRAGIEVLPVPEQAEPDPDFPTVAFPNPEEPGALDLALNLARAENADLVLANDPDADRCSVAIPAAGAPGGWRQLTGDEIGALLGARAARDHQGQAGALLASSVVSSQLLGRIATAHGLEHRETLTGFKWIARADATDDAVTGGAGAGAARLVFGYEEAIGYCCDPEAVRDKDGISAAVVIARLAAELRAEGRSLQDGLDDLARDHGVHLTAQVSLRVADLSRMTEIMARWRATPPHSLAGSAVEGVSDLALGERLPPTDALIITTADGSRVIVRPSGTEPKLKCYLEVIEAGGDRAEDALHAARERAQSRLEALRTAVEELLEA
nr:phospho-sugar mutase [Bogoriella caseilytica]